MDNRLDNNYIGNAIDELVGSLGIREDAPRTDLLKLFSRGRTKECIETIASHLGLPIKVNLSYVPKSYKPGDANQFQSYHLVKTDYTGHGVEGIIAQVAIPRNLPLYGTPELRGFPIDVRISENCADYPESFIANMAHELSHIVLHSLWHKDKENEFYTDLAAMILGFSAIMKNGRKVVETESSYLLIGTRTTTRTMTYGYLSDEQFDFAFNKLNGILNGHRALKAKLWRKLGNYQSQVSSSKKVLLRFKRYLEYLDKHRDQAIRREDHDKIILFHQANYTHEYESAIKIHEQRLKGFLGFHETLCHYTKQRLELLRKYDGEIETLTSDLKKKLDLLNEDASLLKKYVGLFYKLKLNLWSTLYDK